jgi:hypothetical protein
MIYGGAVAAAQKRWYAVAFISNGIASGVL